MLRTVAPEKESPLLFLYQIVPEVPDVSFGEPRRLITSCESEFEVRRSKTSAVVLGGVAAVDNVDVVIVGRSNKSSSV